MGAPLCRNEEYLDTMLKFALSVVFAGMAADHSPFFLRRVVIWYLFRRHGLHERATKILGPLIDERKRMQRELGDRWEAEKPSDVIQWLLDAGAKSPETTEVLSFRIMGFNLAAIHTTSLVSVHIIHTDRLFSPASGYLSHMSLESSPCSF